MNEIDWSKAPEGADKYNTYNKLFYKGAQPDLQVFTHGGWKRSVFVKSDERFVCRPTTPSWSGEGLPPAGVVCEVYHDGDWYETKIIGVDTDDGSCVFKTHGDCDTPYDGFVSASSFRPIRTPEQIAEEERELDQALREACEIVGCAPGSMFGIEVVKKLIDAGYRKP